MTLLYFLALFIVGSGASLTISMSTGAPAWALLLVWLFFGVLGYSFFLKEDGVRKFAVLLLVVALFSCGLISIGRTLIPAGIAAVSSNRMAAQVEDIGADTVQFDNATVAQMLRDQQAHDREMAQMIVDVAKSGDKAQTVASVATAGADTVQALILLGVVALLVCGVVLVLMFGAK